MENKIKVFSGNSNQSLAEKICSSLGVPLGSAKVKTFSDGEIMVEIGENKGAAILKKVQTDWTGNLRKRAVSVVGKHYISCVAVPGRVRSNQFVDGVPPMLVSGRAGSVF